MLHGKLTININPNFEVHCSVEDEFDEIVKDIDINISYVSHFICCFLLI